MPCLILVTFDSRICSILLVAAGKALS